MTIQLSLILYPSDVVKRVSLATGVPLKDIAGEVYTTKAVEARMLAVWLARQAMREGRWNWREIGEAIKRPADVARAINAAASDARLGDADWRRTAYALLKEIVPPKRPIGGKFSKNPLRHRVAVPPPPPLPEANPVSENSKKGDAIADLGCQRTNVEQDRAFAAAMRAAGWPEYIVGANGERKPVVRG